MSPRSLGEAEKNTHRRNQSPNGKDSDNAVKTATSGFPLEKSHQTGPEPAKVTLKPAVRAPLLVAVFLAFFLFCLDNTVTADVQPAIIDSLGEIQKLPWISVAYGLGGIATNLFWGKLFGEFDNKILFIIGFVIFEAGSAVCGSAATMNAFIVGRTVCGIGGIGLYLGALNIVALVTSELERPIFNGVVGLTWGAGTVLGPIVGGSLASSPATWRWAFYLNLCVGAVVAPVIIFVMPKLRVRENQPVATRIRNIDFAGAVMIAGAITTLLTGISFGGAIFAWDDGSTIALFVVSGLLWILFSAQQYFCILTTSQNRLFPAQFVRDFQMNILFITMAAGQVVLYVTVYFIPLYFQIVRGDSALQAGISVLPFIGPAVFSTMLNGALMGPLGWYMPWYLIGGIICLVGTNLLRTISVSTSDAQIYGYMALTGFSLGLFAQSGFAITQVKKQGDDVAPAVAFISIAQLGGIALGFALSNSIFLNEATNKIAVILPAVPRGAVQAAIAGIHDEALLEIGVSSEAKAMILRAISDSLDQVLILIVVAAVMIVVAALVMKRERLFEQPATDDVKQEVTPDARTT